MCNDLLAAALATATFSIALTRLATTTTRVAFATRGAAADATRHALLCCRPPHQAAAQLRDGWAPAADGREACLLGGSEVQQRRRRASRDAAQLPQHAARLLLGALLAWHTQACILQHTCRLRRRLYEFVLRLVGLHPLRGAVPAAASAPTATDGATTVTATHPAVCAAVAAARATAAVTLATTTLTSTTPAVAVAASAFTVATAISAVALAAATKPLATSSFPIASAATFATSSLTNAAVTACAPWAASPPSGYPSVAATSDLHCCDGLPWPVPCEAGDDSVHWHPQHPKQPVRASRLRV